MRNILMLFAGLVLAANGASAQRVREGPTVYHCTLVCAGTIPTFVASPSPPSSPLAVPRPLTPRSLDDVFAVARGDTTDRPVSGRGATVTPSTCSILVLVPRPCDRPQRGTHRD